jgi:hypothetical protein
VVLGGLVVRVLPAMRLRWDAEAVIL